MSSVIAFTPVITPGVVEPNASLWLNDAVYRGLKDQAIERYKETIQRYPSNIRKYWSTAFTYAIDTCTLLIKQLVPDDVDTVTTNVDIVYRDDDGETKPAAIGDVSYVDTDGVSHLLMSWTIDAYFFDEAIKPTTLAEINERSIMLPMLHDYKSSAPLTVHSVYRFISVLNAMALMSGAISEYDFDHNKISVLMPVFKGYTESTILGVSVTWHDPSLILRLGAIDEVQQSGQIYGKLEYTVAGWKSLESCKEFINGIVELYKYRSVPARLKEAVHDVYKSHLNGFDQPDRPLYINGTKIAERYERVVIGDYGAYVEFAADDINVPMIVPYNQQWRLDSDYVAKHKLSIKYHHYEIVNGIKVYHQVATVKYADYKPGYYYISVLDFD